MAAMQRSDTITHLVMQEKGVMGFVEDPIPALSEGQALVRTLYDGISTGTELAFFLGTNPKMDMGWDAERRLFRADLPPDANDSYPKHEGYMPSGIIEASRNPKLPEGTLVAGQYNHKTHHVAGQDEHLIPLPEGFNPLHGIWAGKFGPICLNGVLVAADEVTRRNNLKKIEGTLEGQRIAVLGAGMVGLLVGKFAQWAGAEDVVIVDREEQAVRLAAAEKLGMSSVAAHPELAIELKDRWKASPENTGADLMFQCTGATALLADAFRGVRQEGLVVDLGFYQGGSADVRLGEEFHHNQVRHRCAQIGGIPRTQSERWDRRRLAEATVEFLQDHGNDMEQHTVTHIVPYQGAQELFARLAARDQSILQAVLKPNAAR